MPSAGKDEVYVGLDCGRREYVISPQMVQEYADAIQDHHPWYFNSSPFGGPVAPALVRHSEVYVDRRWYLPNIYGNLHAKQEWELFAPISDSGVSGTVVGKEREKEAGRKFAVGKGTILEELAPLKKEVGPEMCIGFSGPGKNYHTDREEARKLGFPEVVTQGMMSICFLSELMTRRFGEDWYCGGKMAVNLVNILWQGETVTSHGIIKEFTPEGSRQRAHLEVWCQKADGTVITVGSASAVIAG